MAVRGGNEPGGRSVEGAYFLDALKQEFEALPIVGQVRAVGMWLAVGLTIHKIHKTRFADDTVAVIAKRMYEKGRHRLRDRHRL